ncbi:MAG: cobalt ECF transporter T component CbiQ [Armatimonadetes bacterium]|nr:cobalt ECF transporter T component CbiQ [Armatimonadota bacterium]
MTPPCDRPEQAGRREPADRVDPRVAVVCVLTFVTVQAATPIEEWPCFVAYGALAMAAVVWSRVSPAWLLRRLGLAAPLVAGVALSVVLVRPGPDDGVPVPGTALSVSGPLLVLLGSVVAKATLSIVALSLPIALWEFPLILRSLQALRLPRLFVMLIGFMWRYVYLLGDEARRMTQARDARGPRARLVRRALTVGAMTGALFIRGYERAERVGHAMVARGYDGRLRLPAPLRPFGLHDAAVIVLVAAALCAIRLFGAAAAIR